MRKKNKMQHLMMIYKCRECECEWLCNFPCASCVNCDVELISDDYIGEKYLNEEK